MGLATPRLLALGLLRFAVLAAIALAAIILTIDKYQQILGLMWTRPESIWVVWLWYLAAVLVALLLIVISTVAGFLVAQLLFSVVIMDTMSQITERRITGHVRSSARIGRAARFVHLVKQEIPRAVLPLLLSLLLLILGWFTPLGPALTFLAPLAAAVLLAWDNTDLVPARRLGEFSRRFRFLRTHLGFHLGFGILFLIPVLNILLLSFAPVGATLYYIEKIDAAADVAPRRPA